jgi:hypothetical protein
VDELSLYKIKEELTVGLTAYVDKRLETEKSLIISYIGWGARIAIAGLALAVLIVGFFGWKTYDDINKSIISEIKERFDKDNPVRKYDSLLKDAAIRGIVSSVRSQLIRSRQNLYIDEKSDYATFFANALQDVDVTTKEKIEIIEFASAISDSSLQSTIANSARHLIKTSASDNSDDNIQLMSRLVGLYATLNGHRFGESADYTSDVIDIYTKTSDSKVYASVAEYLLTANNAQSTALIKKVHESDDPRIRYAMMISELKFSDESKLDENYIRDLAKKSTEVRFGESDPIVTLSDLVSSLVYLDQHNRNFWPLASLIASTLREAGVSIKYNIDFVSSEPRVLIGSRNFNYVFTLDQINKVTKKVSDAFLEKTNAFADTTPEIINTLEFWTIKDTDSLGKRTTVEIKSYFLYEASGDLFDESGEKIGDTRIGGRLVLFATYSSASSAQLGVCWRDGSGELRTKYVARIKGMEQEKLHLKGVPRLFSYYDEL